MLMSPLTPGNWTCKTYMCTVHDTAIYKLQNVHTDLYDFECRGHGGIAFFQRLKTLALLYVVIKFSVTTIQVGINLICD